MKKGQYIGEWGPQVQGVSGVPGVPGIPLCIPSHDVREFGATALNMELSLLLFVGSRIWLVHNITKGSIYWDKTHTLILFLGFLSFSNAKNDDLLFDYYLVTQDCYDPNDSKLAKLGSCFQEVSYLGGLHLYHLAANALWECVWKLYGCIKD